jgi:hypothetical protein
MYESLAAVAVMVLLSGAAAQAEMLLAQHTYVSGSHSSWFGPGQFSKVKFYPEHLVPSEDPLVAGEPESPWWYDGQSGSFDLTPATATNFDAFADAITDGQDHNLYLVEFVASADDVYTAQTGDYGAESDVLDAAPDLVGYDVTRIHVNVSNVDFFTDSEGWKHCEALLSWQFYGIPVPEPTMLALLGLGVMAVASRRR